MLGNTDEDVLSVKRRFSEEDRDVLSESKRICQLRRDKLDRFLNLKTEHKRGNDLVQLAQLKQVRYWNNRFYYSLRFSSFDNLNYILFSTLEFRFN